MVTLPNIDNYYYRLAKFWEEIDLKS